MTGWSARARRPSARRRARDDRGARSSVLHVAALTLLVCGVGCAGDVVAGPPDAPDRAMFERDVYPVLLRNCAFPDCHANHERFLVVYGPGRVRVPFDTELFDPPTPDELSLAYERARSMLRADAPDASLLLRKGLEASAGGASHMGTDSLGRNVFADTSDPEYMTLLRWAQTGAPGVR